MGYTITNNIMYVRDDTGNLVPVSMIASGADHTIQAIKDTASAAEAQIEAKTDEQVARIPEVTTLAEDVNGLKDDLSELESNICTKIQGTEIYTYDDIDWVSGALRLNGEVDNTKKFYYTSDYIDVYGIQSISYDGLRSPSVYHPIFALFDENKQILDTTLGDGTESQSGAFESTESTRYIRVVTYKSASANKFNSLGISYERITYIPSDNQSEIAKLKTKVIGFSMGKKLFSLATQLQKECHRNIPLDIQPVGICTITAIKSTGR